MLQKRQLEEWKKQKRYAPVTDLGPVTADFASVPKDVFVSKIMPYLNSKSLNDLRTYHNNVVDVEDAENNAKEQVERLIENSTH